MHEYRLVRSVPSVEAETEGSSGELLERFCWDMPAFPYNPNAMCDVVLQVLYDRVCPELCANNVYGRQMVVCDYEAYLTDARNY